MSDPVFTREIPPEWYPSNELISAIAAVKNVGAIELTPLYDYIDPGSLDGLIQGDPDASLRLEFDYEGYRVLITGQRRLSIFELSSDKVQSIEE